MLTNNYATDKHNYLLLNNPYNFHDIEEERSKSTTNTDIHSYESSKERKEKENKEREQNVTNNYK